MKNSVVAGNKQVGGLLLLGLFWMVLLPAHGQVVTPTAPPSISTTVSGIASASHTLTAADLAALPRLTLRVADKTGQKHRYSGFALSEVLRLAQAPQGKVVHGPVAAYALLVGGADGYQALFALPEADTYFTSQTILLADQRDGQPLPPDQGPYQVVVPGDKHPTRWVRQVTSLRVSPVKSE